MKSPILSRLLIVLMLFWLPGLLGAEVKIPKEVRDYTLKFHQGMTAASQELIDSLGTVESSSDVVRAMDQYRTRIQPLVTGLVKLRAKHADFFAIVDAMADPDALEMDEAVQRAEAAFDATSDRMESALAGIMRFMGDPQVQAAIRRWQQVMAEIAIEDEEDEDWDE